MTLNGVKNILASCEKAARLGTLKRYVHTSSMATIVSDDVLGRGDGLRHVLVGWLIFKGYLFTESDNNTCATLEYDAYSLSKILSERVIDEFIAALPSSSRFSYVYVNPSVIYGPLMAPSQVTGSPQFVFDMMTGKFPLYPNLGFATVDVRDVARAHIIAMVNTSLSGRFILNHSNVSFRDMSQYCRANGFAQVGAAGHGAVLSWSW